jgi:hypothetical protein
LSAFTMSCSRPLEGHFKVSSLYPKPSVILGSRKSLTDISAHEEITPQTGAIISWDLDFQTTLQDQN